MHTLLSSLDNRHVKELLHLAERHYRNETGLFLIEGYRELLRAYEGKAQLDRLFICQELFLGTNEQKLIDDITARGCKVFTCTPKVFKKISYRDRPDGLIAIAKQMPQGLSALPKVENPLYIVAEAIEKPGNLGTILRTADAAGANAVIVCNRCTDIYNPNVIRASTGILFCLPVIEATSEDTIAYLKREKIKIVAARPQATTLFTEIDMKEPLAIAVGTEQLGLSPIWQNEADIEVRIPMHGKADSLNVAQATTLLLYEAARQRHSHSL